MSDTVLHAVAVCCSWLSSALQQRHARIARQTHTVAVRTLSSANKPDCGVEEWLRNEHRQASDPLPLHLPVNTITYSCCWSWRIAMAQSGSATNAAGPIPTGIVLKLPTSPTIDIKTLADQMKAQGAVRQCDIPAAYSCEVRSDL